MGNKNRGVVCLDAVRDRGDEVVGVLAPPEDAIANWYPSLADHGRSQDLPVRQPEDVNDPAVVETLESWDPDVIVMAGYSQILHEPILSIPDRGVLNLHGGKLPEFRGGSTLNWMIIEGESAGGVAVLFAEETIDTGDIVVQERFPIDPDDTIVDVIEKTDEIFPGLLTTALDRLEDGDLDPTPQSLAEGSYYHSRRPRDGVIDWQRQTAREVNDLVRALAGPYPSAFTTYDGERLRIEETSMLARDVRGVPGRVPLRHDDGVIVVAADEGVLVETVSRPGGETVPAVEFFDAVGVDLGS